MQAKKILKSPGLSPSTVFTIKENREENREPFTVKNISRQRSENMEDMEHHTFARKTCTGNKGWNYHPRSSNNTKYGANVEVSKRYLYSYSKEMEQFTSVCVPKTI